MDTLLKSLLQGARVTETDPDREDALLLDIGLMEAVKLAPYERVAVVNADSGLRFDTHVLPAARGSGVVGLNGGAAKMGGAGERLDIRAFRVVSPARLAAHRPLAITLGEGNRPVGGLREL